MKTKSLSFKISPTIGTVSAECFIPQKSKCIMTLAHGAGAGMHHSFMVTLSQSLFAAGKSFGGRMTSQCLAAYPNDQVKGIIFYGFPLHAPGKPSIERAEHLKDVKTPMLFLQGTRDELAKWDLIESVCASLPLAT